MYKRIVLKLSGEALAGNTSQSFDKITTENIVNQIKTLVEKDLEICIVVGGGNFWRGRSANQNMDRVTADQIGMMATVMNAFYLADLFCQNSIDSAIMTPFPIGTMTEQFSKKLALSYLSKKRVLIFAGGIGHPFFSTDTITALRASELLADAILFAKNVDGVYNKDPNQFSDAKKFDTIKCKDIIEQNLKVIDITAASLCYEQKIPVVIFGLLEQDSIIKAALKQKIGTIITE